MAFALILLAIPVTVHAQDPDFSTDDPLEGQWELSRVTDLVLYQTHSADSNTKSEILNYYLETEDSKVVTQTAKTILTAPCWLAGQREPQITRAARFFALPNDVAITMAPSANAGNPDCASTNSDSNMGLYIVDTKTNAAPIWVHFFASAKQTAMAMADFNQDGLEDLFILNDTQAFVATATDVYSPTAGMTFGQRMELGSTTLAPAVEPVTADFNDDGLIDVAWIGQDSTLYFATVCPGSVMGTPCDGKAALDVVLNPLNARKNVITPPNASCWVNSSQSKQALAAGNFFVDASSGTEQFGRLVALGCAQPPSGPRMRAYSYKFDSTMAVTQQQFIDVVACQQYCGTVFAEGVRLDWNAAIDQVAFTFAYIWPNNDEVAVVGVLSWSGVNMAAHNNSFDIGAPISGPNRGMLGLAAGRFDAIPTPAGSQDYNPQIAVALNLPQLPPRVYIFRTDPPANFVPSQISSIGLDASLGTLNQESAFNKLVAGDLQGRSDHLGPPTKIKVESHLQPAVVLAAPPMHADYVLPDQQTANGPAIVNFTAVPNAYNTAYTQGGSTSSNSARTDTTSYTYSYAESTDEKFSFNVPLISGVSGEFKQSWKQQYDKTSTNYSYDKVEDDYSLAQASGLNDTIWYQSNDFYVYFYPVLGQKVCPAELPNCTADRMQPLYVSFSGPVDSVISPLDGGTTEWYQPVHEEGQIFSYAWDISQLKTRFPESSVMSTDDVVLTTDTSPAIQRSVKWLTDSQQQTSTQNTFTHSFESDNSITVGGVDKDTGGAEFSGSFDYNSSKAVSTLNTSSTDLGAYTQIDLNRPSFPDGSLYKYSFQPLVISQSAPTGTVQTIDAPATVYTTTGTISTEYFVQPPTSPEYTWGDWWGTSTNWYRQNIDIALNHPNRWNENGSDCDYTEQYAGQCIQPNLPQLQAFGAANDEPYISQWHHMRGLLVTVGAPGGPQRVAAQVGDTVYLQARVYNYSLVPMAATDRIKVQFYRQGYEDSALIGAAVLITETTVAPLPAFGNSALTPNWTTVTAQFTATEALSGTNQVFWVVTWAEDSSGNLVQEVTGHGLTSKPGVLISIVDVPIEAGPTVTTTTNTSATTSFSNNVGLFHLPFCIGVCANTDQAAPNPPVVSISNLGVVPLGNQRLPQYMISAEIRATNGGAEAVLVSLVEEDGIKRTIRNVDILPFVADTNSQVIRMPFTPERCNTHILLLEVRSRNAGTAVQRLTIDAECRAYLPIINLGQ